MDKKSYRVRHYQIKRLFSALATPTTWCLIGPDSFSTMDLDVAHTLDVEPTQICGRVEVFWAGTE